MFPSRYTLALALGLALQASAGTPTEPLAPGYAERAALMEQCFDYVGASDQLRRYLDAPQQLNADASQDNDEARLTLMQALLLNGERQQMRLIYEDFMRLSPASELAFRARALLGDSHFFAGEFGPALDIYRELDINAFPAPAAAGTLYRKAYSLLRLSEYNEAADTFASLLGEEGYNGIARFYLAYISYKQEDYRRALADLRNLPAGVAFDMGADFYIAQILFQGRQYSEVLAMQPQLLSAAARIQTGELNASAEAYRLLGESAHATGASEKARGYLRRHVELHENGGELSARYILGAADYAEGSYDKAAEWLRPVAALDNALGQSALLYLGQCSARSGDYSAAAMNFDRAARMDYDPTVSETALYDYAAALARGGNVPFGSATDLLEKFAAKYPDSPYAPAVEEYLATGYYREHRYADALNRIARISRPSASVLALKQRAQFDLGADLLSAGRASEAKSYLQAAASSTADPALATSARLWQADCLYRLKEYPQALTAYDQYLSAASRTDSQRPLAEYNRAYTLFQLGRYAQARTGFESALNNRLDSSLRTDATLRIADCRNFTGDVSGALETYRRAAAMNDASATDYAMFQTANMLGVLGRNSEKAATLQKLLAERPGSSWCSAALAELAEAQQASGDLAAARATIARLEREYPDSEQLRIASLSMADALADKAQTSEAIAAYEQLVRRWPTSPQARVAAENLQTICTEQGQLDRYLSFIKSVPQAPQPDAERVAKLAYQAAMNAVEKNPADLTPLEKFVAEYPTAADTPDALVELADDYMTLGNTDKALQAAERILSTYPHSKGVPSALLIKGNILASRGDNAGASAAYTTLLNSYGTTYARQAYAGLMSTCENPAQTIVYADNYLALPDIPASERTKATLVKAKALAMTGRAQEALSLYATLSSDMRSATGGEAAVMMARIYLEQGQYAKAEQLMTKFTAGGCDDMDWLARGYIALADAYAAQSRTSLAVQYLQALKENYPQAPAEITDAITTRLNKWK